MTPPPLPKKKTNKQKTRTLKKKERFIFLFVNLDSVLYIIQLLKNNTKILRIKGVAIRAMKFEAVRIHFLGDVFDAVAVFVAYALCYHRYRHCKT